MHEEQSNDLPAIARWLMARAKTRLPARLTPRLNGTCPLLLDFQTRADALT